MNAWIPAILVISVAAAGIILGICLNRTYRTAITGAFAAVGLIALLLTAHLLHLWTFYGGLDWIAASRSKYILIGFAVCLGLVSPLKYLHSTWKQASTIVVLAILILLFVGIPFIGPAVNHHEIQSLPTQFDRRGLCLQSRPYTCGPAAAVTALRQLGLTASEARIAEAAGTTPLLGTCSWDLYQALNHLYPQEDLQCRYGRFENIDQLPDDSPTLAVMREGFMLDHCVTILKITRTDVLFADPSSGLCSMSKPAFEAAWRHTGIVLSRPRFFSIVP